jgi:uncharacterized protein (DUF4415 family)
MERPEPVKVVLPTPEEDAAITAAATFDPDAPPLSDQEMAALRPVGDFPDLVQILQKNGKLGRPPLPVGDRKQRVTLHLDPDVLRRLKAEGKGWQTRANAALRQALGL